MMVSIESNNDPLYYTDDENEPCRDSTRANNHGNCTTFPNLLPDEDTPQISSPCRVFRADWGTLGWFLLMVSFVIVYYIRRQRLNHTPDTSRNEYQVVSMKLAEHNQTPIIDSPTGIEEAFDGCFCVANGLEGYSGHERSL
eukprot:scaffold353_cov185-Amphora_coffeaeformis.AAC.83